MTARNLKFIELYIQYVVLGQAPSGKRCSAAQALIDAGYKSKNPDVDACKLQKKASIATEIERRKQEILNKEKLTTEKVLHELCLIGFANMADYYNEDGSLKEISELTRDQAAAIQEVCIDKNGRKTYKLFSKPGSLELLGKNRGAFTEKIAIGGDAENDAPVKTEIIFKGIPRPNKEDLKRPESR